MSLEQEIREAKAERDKLIAQVAAKQNISQDAVKQQLASGTPTNSSSASSSSGGEAVLNRHLIHAQLPVLNQAEQIKLAASSGASSGKQILQNGVNLLEQGDDKIDLDTYRRMRFQFGTNLKAFGDSSLKTGLNGAANQIDSLTSGVNQVFGATSTLIAQNLMPVSSFMGSTLGTLTGVMNNPVGTLNDLPNMLGNLMDRTNPRLRGKLEMSLQKFNIDKLAEVPKSLVASVEQFAQTVQGIIATPMRMISDLYYGAMGIMDKITTFINSLFNNVQMFVNNVVDIIFPGLMEFLSSLLNFGGKIGGLLSSFGVNNMLGGALNQAMSFASNIGKLTANPTTLLFSQLPDGISKGMHNFQDPQALIQKFIPPKFGSFLNNVGGISGFGRGGNMGLNLGQVLGGMKAGVLTGILDTFGSQLSILNPILNRTMHDVQSYEYYTEQMALKGGTTYNISTVGDRILNQPRTRVNREATADLSDPPVAPLVNYASRNKLEQQISDAKAERANLVSQVAKQRGISEAEVNRQLASGSPTINTGGGMSQQQVDSYIAKNNPAAAKQIAAMKADRDQWAEKARQARIASEQ